MKQLALPILVCSIAGLVSLFLPNGPFGSMFKVFLEFDQVRLFLMIAAFGVPAAGSVLALTKEPKTWYAFMALGGFAVATVKAEVWTIPSHLGSAPISIILMFGAIVIGAICSILAVAKQQEAEAAS